MEDTLQLKGDLLVAQDAVHEVCDFLHNVFARSFGPQITTRCRGIRSSPVELAAQALLTARIKRRLPYDSFIAEFRDPRDLERSPLTRKALSETMNLLAFAERHVPDAQKDHTLRREKPLRSYLDGAGRIHSGGLIPTVPHAFRPDPPAASPNKTAGPASKPEERAEPTKPPPGPKDDQSTMKNPEPTKPPSGPKDNQSTKHEPEPSRAALNRVWVLEPMDDLAAAMDGKEFCVSATLFQKGVEMVTVIAVSNLISETETSVATLPGAYGEMYGAVRGGGAFCFPIGWRRRGFKTLIQLDPRCPEMSYLPGHRAFPRLRVVIPASQHLDSRGRLTPKETLPPGKVPPPTSPRAHQLKNRPTFNDPVDERRIDKCDMACTGPKLESLLHQHAESTYAVRSSLLCYIAVAQGHAHASICIPASCLAHSDNFLWREAGGALLLREAGGVVTDAEGQELDFAAGRTLRRNFGILATCPGATHWRLLDAIKGDLVVGGTGDMDGPDGGTGAGRWAKGRNMGPWASAAGRGDAVQVTTDHGKPALLPRHEDGTPKPLCTHAFRALNEWPCAWHTWHSGLATGPWMKEDGKPKRAVLPGRSAGARYLPEVTKAVEHDGPCAWPCANCEPEEHGIWYAGAGRRT